jgi:hypothetical protein
MLMGRSFVMMLIFAGVSGCLIFRDPMTVSVIRGGREGETEFGGGITTTASGTSRYGGGLAE